MAKAPRPGACKTRLTPPLSPEQAAELGSAFLSDVSANLVEAGRQADIIPYVAFAPAGTEHLFGAILAPGTALVLADGSVDVPDGVEGFGRCLLHAVRALLAAGHDSVCVLNADSPNLPTATLIQAARLLAEPGDRAVLGAAEDGGYFLLGLKQPHDAPFSRIAWSTGAVAEQTRARCRAAGLPVEELPPWYDVDDAASLRRLFADMDAGQGYAAHATRNCADRLGLHHQLQPLVALGD